MNSVLFKVAKSEERKNGETEGSRKNDTLICDQIYAIKLDFLNTKLDISDSKKSIL